MEKVITVKSVQIKHVSNGKGEWMCITDAEGKTSNIFPKTPGYNLIAEGKALKITLEKGEKYWDVTNIEDIGQPEHKPEIKPEVPFTNGKVTNGGPAIIPVTDSRNKSMALSYAKDLVVAGQLDIKDIYNQAHEFELYLNAQFNPIYQPNWRG